MIHTGPRAPAAPRAVGYVHGALEALTQLRDGGRVLSRYQRVVNLETARGRLLALHAAVIPPTPFSVVLAAAPTDWPGPDTRARRRDDDLWVGHVRVDLSAMREIASWQAPVLRGLRQAAFVTELLAPMAAASAFGSWWRDANGAEATDPLAAALRARARRVVPALADALAAAPPQSATAFACAQQLVGAGPGGTPSGDDLLVGLVGAWLRLSPRPAAAELLANSLAVWAPDRTTRLAAEFYYHLARGRLSGQLDDLLRVVAAGNAPAIEHAARALARYGATSGRDTIAGVHAYVTALEHNRASDNR